MVIKTRKFEIQKRLKGCARAFLRFQTRTKEVPQIKIDPNANLLQFTRRDNCIGDNELAATNCNLKKSTKQIFRSK